MLNAIGRAGPIGSNSTRFFANSIRPIPIMRRFCTGSCIVNRPMKTPGCSSIGASEPRFTRPARPMAFSIAPDLRRGYGLLQDIGEYELWTFDVGARRVMARTPFPGRPRMALRVSGNGNVIYIYQAGNTIDLHDAATFKRLRTITLDGDMTTPLLRVPAAKPSAAPGGVRAP